MRTIAIAAAILGSAVLLAQESGPSPVTWQDLLQQATRTPHAGDLLRRLHRSATQSADADHAGQRASPHGAVDVPDRHRARGAASRGRRSRWTRVVRDRAERYAWAIDARTGRPFWKYRRVAAGRPHLRRDFAREPRLRHPRRQAVHGHGGRAPDRARPANRLRGLGRRDRPTTSLATRRRWRRLWSRTKSSSAFPGSDYPTRGFIDAYDAADRQARVAVLHGPGRRRARQRDVAERRRLARGGGGTWVTGSYDPALNLLYYGTGNPNPDYYGDDRTATTSIPLRSSRSTPTRAS